MQWAYPQAHARERPAGSSLGSADRVLDRRAQLAPRSVDPALEVLPCIPARLAQLLQLALDCIDALLQPVDLLPELDAGIGSGALRVGPQSGDLGLHQLQLGFH